MNPVQDDKTLITCFQKLKNKFILKTFSNLQGWDFRISQKNIEILIGFL